MSTKTSPVVIIVLLSLFFWSPALSADVPVEQSADLSAPAAAPPRVSVHSSGRYFQDASGTPQFLLGYYDWASVSPNHYIDQPSRYVDMINVGGQYNLNYIRINLGVNRMSSSTDPAVWAGDPTPVPFAYVNNKADLNQWDAAFWSGLRWQIELAAQKDMIVHLPIFDGVDLRGGNESYRWANSFWNIDNQTMSFYGDLDTDNDGNADEGSEFYRTSEFENNTGVGFYQRKLIDKLIVETSGYSNVFFEVGNELTGSGSEWNSAVIAYVRTQTDKVITQNGGSRALNLDGWAGHAANTPAQVKSNVAAIIGQGYPAWEDPDGPLLIQGAPDDLRRAAWYSFVGGAAGWGGFSVDFWNGAVNAQTLSYYQHLADFIEDSDVQFWEMTPQHSLISNSGENSVLAKADVEYVAYVLNDGEVSLNLASLSGEARVRLYDPKTGLWSAAQTINGGGMETFNKPAGAGGWVIYVKRGDGHSP